MLYNISSADTDLIWDGIDAVIFRNQRDETKLVL